MFWGTEGKWIGWSLGYLRTKAIYMEKRGADCGVGWRAKTDFSRCLCRLHFCSRTKIHQSGNSHFQLSLLNWPVQPWFHLASCFPVSQRVGKPQISYMPVHLYCCETYPGPLLFEVGSEGTHSWCLRCSDLSRVLSPPHTHIQLMDKQMCSLKLSNLSASLLVCLGEDASHRLIMEIK